MKKLLFTSTLILFLSAFKPAEGSESGGFLSFVPLIVIIIIIWAIVRSVRKRRTNLYYDTPNEDAQSSDKTKSYDVTMCMHCDKLIKIGSKFCKFCGKEQKSK